MGLWDTVAQFGLNGVANTDWQLAIPPQAKHVFQAVALNENRYLFPGESIHIGVQRGFVGDHADIGGSYGSGDLSNVALNWMVEQARQSGIELYAWGEGLTDESWGKVTEPLFHQKASTNEHSQLCERDNNARSKNCVSRDQWRGGGLSAELGLGFVKPLDAPRLDADGNSLITGTVDMTAYLQWLQENYQWSLAAP